MISVGAVTRLLAMIAYAPALLFPDSWGYIATAYSGRFVGLPTVHPVGYPLLLRLFTLPDRSLAELVTVQHLAGLGIGTAVYVALMFFVVRPLLARPHLPPREAGGPRGRQDGVALSPLVRLA